MKKIFLAGVFGTLLFACTAWGQIILPQPEPVLDITSLVDVAIVPPEVSDPRFIQFGPPLIGKGEGYHAKDVWFRLHLVNQTEEALSRLVYFDSPLAGKLTLIKNSLETSQPIFSGPAVPLAERQVKSRLGAFNVTLMPGEQAFFYLRSSSHHAFNPHLYLSEPLLLEKEEAQNKTLFFFYMGGLLCMIIYNLVIGITAGQKDHVLYALFGTSFGVVALAVHGVLDTYLLPNTKIVFSQYIMLCSSVALIFATLFIERFLYIKKDSFKIGYIVMRVIRGLALIPFGVSFFAPYVRSFYIFGYFIDVLIGLSISFFILCGIHSYYVRKNPMGIYFLASWLSLILGVFVYIGSLHGFVPDNTWTKYSLLLGNMGEMLILSLGLVYKINILSREKQIAQQAAKDKERYHRLVNVLSHDIANAAASLSYHAESLDSMVAENSKILTHVQKIRSATESLEHMLASVRQEEILQAVKVESDFELVDLCDACVDAIDLHLWRAQDKNILLRIDVPVGVKVMVNRSALTNQVIGNVISNAIKFSDENAEILITYSGTDDESILTIEDSGVGMSEEKLRKVFSGQKVNSTLGTNKETGSGIGNKLVYEYMKLFGGRVVVKSTERNGDAPSGTIVQLIFPS